MKINLILYDIDGCLYHKTNKGESIPLWLIENHQNFFNDEINKITKETYNKVIIAYGTNRQDKETDNINSERHKTESSIPVLPIIQSYLANQVNCDVVLDPFLMADIYGNPKNGEDKSPGDSYTTILKEKYLDSKIEKHAKWKFDHSKISLIYAHAHRVATLHAANDQIVIDFYDDTDRILSQVYNFFYNNSVLLPRNVSLRIYKYKHQTCQSVINNTNNTTCTMENIQGSGLVDSNYHWIIRYLSFVAFSYALDIKNNIKTINNLNTCYLNNRYFDKSWRMEIKITYVKPFIKFRDSHIINYKANDNFTQSPKDNSYTTAELLYKNNLIPKEFFIETNKKNENITIETNNEIIMPVPLEQNSSSPEQCNQTKEERRQNLNNSLTSIYLQLTEYSNSNSHKSVHSSSDIYQKDPRQIYQSIFIRTWKNCTKQKSFAEKPFIQDKLKYFFKQVAYRLYERNLGYEKINEKYSFYPLLKFARDECFVDFFKVAKNFLNRIKKYQEDDSSSDDELCRIF